LTKQQERDPWPERRSWHISGGVGSIVIYDDMWLLDPQSGRMEKVGRNFF